MNREEDLLRHGAEEKGRLQGRALLKE